MHKTNIKLSMKKFITFIVFALCILQQGFSQVYLDDFSATPASFVQAGAASYSTSLANGELTVNCTNTGPYDIFTYKMNDGTALKTVDATGNNKIFVRAKASSVGTQLRLDVQDEAGYLTSLAGITKTLTNDYLILEYDFTGNYTDGGYGGTPCSAGPCPVDGSKVANLQFYVNPGQGGFSGSVVIDYISFGESPGGGITSDIFQDHFTQDSSINAFGVYPPGYNIQVQSANSQLVITGDGSPGPYDAFAYDIRNPVTLEPIDIDVLPGNGKLFVKMKSSVANTSFRVDLQDIDSYLTTQGSITKVVGTEWAVYEYDYSGAFADLGYGGSPCTQLTAPCPVDATRIKNLVFFINPGSGLFLGDLTIDYISFGKSLEPAGPEAVKVYEDHFDNDQLDYTTTTQGFTVTEAGTEMVIEGDGSATPYSSVSYILNDRSTGQPIVLDLTDAQNKVYIRAKTESGTVPLRIDLIDTANYITSLPALTRVLSTDYQVFTYDFSGNFTDGGYNGAPCVTGPCPVDPKAIRQMLLYLDPVVGAYTGKVTIDFISIGQPAGPDLGPTGLINYKDEMPDIASSYITSAAGVVSTVNNGIWTLTGDGTVGAYASSIYTLHDDSGNIILGDLVGSNNKMYVRARASVAGTVLRLDVQDNLEYVTNLNARTATLTTDYAVYELDFTGAYLDGAYGGSPCTTSGCLVDGERLAKIQAIINPGTGLYNGTIDIDYISFGSPLSGVTDPAQLASMSIFPNPANAALHLRFETIRSGDVTVELMDAMGKLVQTNHLGTVYGAVNETIELAGLRSGLYFMALRIDGALVGSSRFVKK